MKSNSRNIAHTHRCFKMCRSMCLYCASNTRNKIPDAPDKIRQIEQKDRQKRSTASEAPYLRRRCGYPPWYIYHTPFSAGSRRREMWGPAIHTPGTLTRQLIVDQVLRLSHGLRNCHWCFLLLRKRSDCSYLFAGEQNTATGRVARARRDKDSGHQRHFQGYSQGSPPSSCPQSPLRPKLEKQREICECVVGTGGSQKRLPPIICGGSFSACLVCSGSGQGSFSVSLVSFSTPPRCSCMCCWLSLASSAGRRL